MPVDSPASTALSGSEAIGIAVGDAVGPLLLPLPLGVVKALELVGWEAVWEAVRGGRESWLVGWLQMFEVRRLSLLLLLLQLLPLLPLPLLSASASAVSAPPWN